MATMCFQQALRSLPKKSRCSMRSIKTSRATPSFRKIRIAKELSPGPHGSSQSSADGPDTLPISRQDRLHSTMAWHSSKLSQLAGCSNMCRCASEDGEGLNPHTPLRRPQMLLEERQRAAPGEVGGGLVVACGAGVVVEGVLGAGIDVERVALVAGLQRLLERRD